MLQITTAQLVGANTDLYNSMWPNIDGLEASALGKTVASFAEALAIYNAIGPLDRISYHQQLGSEVGTVNIQLERERDGLPFRARHTDNVPVLALSARHKSGSLFLAMRDGQRLALGSEMASQHSAKFDCQKGQWACERLGFRKRPIASLPLLLKDALEPRG